MSRKTFTLSNTLYDYLLSVSVREPVLLRKLREETAGFASARMQISPELGQLMALLVKLISAKSVLEIGVFTGYSSLSMALALPPQGEIVACDVSDDWTAVARRYWRRAGVAHKIDLRLAPAHKTLDRLLADGYAGHFDFAFIDADKKNYSNYYERTLHLVRPGGLIAVDNVLWSGKVADPHVVDRDTKAIRAFNRKLKRDHRVMISLVPIGDGLTLAMKL
jgi:predicted O-methyltransferase YrrM